MYIFMHLRKANMKVDFKFNASWFVFICSSLIIFMLNVNAILLPIFIQKSHGLHDIIIVKTLKVILLYWNMLFSLLFFIWPNWLHVRSNLVPGLTWHTYRGNYLQTCYEALVKLQKLEPQNFILCVIFFLVYACTSSMIFWLWGRLAC